MLRFTIGSLVVERALNSRILKWSHYLVWVDNSLGAIRDNDVFIGKELLLFIKRDLLESLGALWWCSGVRRSPFDVPLLHSWVSDHTD